MINKITNKEFCSNFDVTKEGRSNNNYSKNKKERTFLDVLKNTMLDNEENNRKKLLIKKSSATNE